MTLKVKKIIHNKLRPNGYIWIDVPLCNKNYFSSRIIDDVGHLYFFDQNTLRNLINDCNFDIVASGSFGKKIATSRKLTSSILLLIKYYLHRYLPLKILNLRKNFQKKMMILKLMMLRKCLTQIIQILTKITLKTPNFFFY